MGNQFETQLDNHMDINLKSRWEIKWNINLKFD